MILAGMKMQMLLLLHAFWLECGGNRGVELTSAAMAATGLGIWIVSWHTQRASRSQQF